MTAMGVSDQDPHVTTCRHEEDVVRLVLDGRWPHAADGDLRAHVERCPVCADVAQVSAWLGTDAMAQRATVSVPASGQIWWRSAVRARLDATEAAARSLLWCQVAGAVVLLVSLAAAAPLVAGWMGFSGSSVAGLLARWGPAAEGLAESGVSWWLLMAAGAGAVMAPIAVYLAVHDD